MASKCCLLLVFAVTLCLSVEAARRPPGLPKPAVKVTKPSAAQAHTIVTQCMAIAKKDLTKGSKFHSDLSDCHDNLYEADLAMYLVNMRRCVEPAAYEKLARCVNTRIAALG